MVKGHLIGCSLHGLQSCFLSYLINRSIQYSCLFIKNIFVLLPSFVGLVVSVCVVADNPMSSSTRVQL